jgi:predicted transcriptional regulator
MTTKQLVLQTVRKLPADASIADAMEQLLFLAKVEKGVQQADQGRTIAHAQVKERMRKWLT